MKKINRVVDNNDFSKIIKQGNVLKNDSYTIHYLKNDLDITRIGISVSTKIANAVTRNRVKRQVRSMCDSSLDYIKNSIDVIIVVRNNYLINNYENNLKTLSNLLIQIGII